MTIIMREMISGSQWKIQNYNIKRKENMALIL